MQSKPDDITTLKHSDKKPNARAVLSARNKTFPILVVGFSKAFS